MKSPTHIQSRTIRALAIFLALFLALIAPLIVMASQAGPDPKTVQQWQSAWRYPQAGWTVVHIEGEPYARGLQHGHLLAPEIVAYIQALSQFWGPESPKQAWNQTRTLANALFLRGFTPEQLQEMKGIADGATAEGAKVDGRAIDLVDIVTLNVANEIDTLDDALQATPTGLESFRPPQNNTGKLILPSKREKRKPLRCNAFAATGPATKDGKLVFGHITMYDLLPANFYNVWMDVQPTKGYRFVMQTTPGGIQSGMDYAINEAGILLSETTLDQGKTVTPGIPLAARIRQAQQYADSIETAAKMLTGNGNGLCTTEWILADIRRNEIALLTLDTNKSVLHRSSRNEWIDGAEGFYWSDNNTKDLSVRLQTVSSLDGRPSPVGAFAPSKRDAIWMKMYDQYKGKIDLDFAQRLLTTPEIVSAFAVDAKYTNAELASTFQTWASFGPPVGGIWKPTLAEQKRYTGIKPLIHNPWTILENDRPTMSPDATDASDLATLNQSRPAPTDKRIDEAAWHGTLLPASDADIWLTTAFANYERVVALERKLGQHARTRLPTPDDQDQIGVEIAYYRSVFGHNALAAEDFPLSRTRSTYHDEHWYGVATGKGVLFLHALRGIVGAEQFDTAMDEFGTTNAGKPVSTDAFRQFLQKRTDYALPPVFDWWLNRTGLPVISIKNTKFTNKGKEWQTTVEFDTEKLGPALRIPVSIETEDDEVTVEGLVTPSQPQIVVTTKARPERLVVDKYGTTPRSNGSPYTILSFDDELEKALIVYGTRNEAVANQESAKLLQQSLRRREHNVQASIKADSEVTDNDIRNHHLILLGRPGTNLLSERFAAQIPVQFGVQSFEVRGDLYTHPESAVVAAGNNPLNSRYAIVLIAGLSGLGTYQVIPMFEDDILSYAPTAVLPHGGQEDDFVPPLQELTIEFKH